MEPAFSEDDAMSGPAPQASTLMLISSDTSLVHACQEIVDSFSDVRLLVVAHAGEAEGYLTHEKIKLLLVHVVDDKGTSEVIGLLHRLACLEHAPPLLVICERPNALQAWSLKQLGAADYLTRPIALHRLNYFLFESCFTHDELTQILAATPSLLPMAERIALAGEAEDHAILVTGEVGTGKTWLARLIHAYPEN
jgi:DNA-binding NtrC family response regulator